MGVAEAPTRDGSTVGRRGADPEGGPGGAQGARARGVYRFLFTKSQFTSPNHCSMNLARRFR
jgi:hypothetical protein